MNEFVCLVDRGVITPIINEYSLYADTKLIAPIVLERRPHIPEQRIRLEMLGNTESRWRQLVTALDAAQGLFPSHELIATDEGDSVSFKGIHVAYACLSAMGREAMPLSVS
jgi:hypothetical protein